MQVINVRNVHEALPKGIKLLMKEGKLRKSRAGDVLWLPEPVATVYKKPLERVMFWPKRDANPFFHFFEALWMLAGRNDIKFLTRFVPNMLNYSDDGETQYGAYGYRWKKHWMTGDQLPIIAKRLKDDPDDRRSVLTMWDPGTDLDHNGKDVPCNTHIYFTRNSTAELALDMTVCCRSNDMIWGAYGANAVHMSFLQEYMAAMIGCPVGTYTQISNNFHAYTNIVYGLDATFYDDRPKISQPYTPSVKNKIKPFPLLAAYGLWGMEETIEMFDADLTTFFHGVDTDEFLEKRETMFFEFVVYPLWQAHLFYKVKYYKAAIQVANTCLALDWKKACIEWLGRREANYNKAKDDGVNHDNGK